MELLKWLSTSLNRTLSSHNHKCPKQQSTCLETWTSTQLPREFMWSSNSLNKPSCSLNPSPSRTFYQEFSSSKLHHRFLNSNLKEAPRQRLISLTLPRQLHQLFKLMFSPCKSLRLILDSLTSKHQILVQKLQHRNNRRRRMLGLKERNFLIWAIWRRIRNCQT